MSDEAHDKKRAKEKPPIGENFPAPSIEKRPAPPPAPPRPLPTRH
jgi:hypothetical protein